jgi:transglutaminase-like putative cysteine protease
MGAKKLKAKSEKVKTVTQNFKLGFCKDYFRRKLVCLWLIFLVFSITPVFAGDVVTYTNPKHYHVRQTACSYNKNITTMINLELNVPLPENWPGCKVSNVNVTGDEPFLLHNTEGPGQIYRVVYKNGLPAKGDVAFVSVEYDVKLWEVNIDYEALVRRTYPAYNKDSEYEYYTRPSPEDTTADNPQIQVILNQLQQNTNRHPVLYAKAVYDWLAKNIQYGRPSLDLKVCLKERKGDCAAIAFFFVDFCRAAGIPARFVAGCWAGGTASAERPDGWHCWAEFYLPGVGWVPIDHSPAGGFGHLSNNHLPLVKAGNMKFEVDPNKGGDKAGFVQPGYWFYWFGGGGEGGLIDTEFAVESFCYAEMPKINNKEDLQKAFLEANKCFNEKNYDRALQIYRCITLSEYVQSGDKDRLHYRMAKCFLEKNRRVKASLELLPLIQGHPGESIAKRAEELLRSVRKEEVYLSTLNVDRIRQGWGAPHVDRSVEGRTLSIGGKKFERGIGTHSESICLIATNDAVEEFSAYVGVDDEVEKGRGSVEFLVVGDDKILWQSGIMKSGDPAKHVMVKTKGIKELTLKVGNGGDNGDGDHADWADAKVLITGIYPTILPKPL